MAPTSSDVEVDMCVLGAGIIGLCTSLALLRADPQLRVALVDAAQPCAGATGAGQGYLWLAHRDPASPAWQLAVRSKQLWQELLASTLPQLTQGAVEWQV
jgi:glycine/D-amino acid oxidase-like deaminating enzyme